MKKIKLDKLGITLIVFGASMVVIPIFKFLFWANFWLGIIFLGLFLGAIGLALVDWVGDN